MIHFPRPLLLTARLLGCAFASAVLAFGASCGDETPSPASGDDPGTGGALQGQGGGIGAGKAGSAGSLGVAGSAAGMPGGAGAAGSGGSSVGGSGSGGASGGAGPASPCAAKAYKLCEDFESGASGALPTGWTKFKGYADGSPQDVLLGSEEFHSGAQALKSSSLATGQTRAQHSLAALGGTASKHWGRIFYKVPAPATKPSDGVLHVTFVGLMGTGENRVVDIVEDNEGMHQWLYNNPNDQGSKGSAYDWKFDDAWHCAEWFVDVGAKSYRFFSDAKEVTSIGFTGKGDAQMSSYTAIIVGAEFYQMPPVPFVVWFDDLAIDDAQIGCQ